MAEEPKKSTVSQLWKEITGLPWSEAKKLGYSDGSFKTNLALRKKLVSGKITKKDIEKAKEQAASRMRETKAKAAKSSPVTRANEITIERPKGGMPKGKKMGEGISLRSTVADKMDKEVAESKASPTKAALRKKIRAEKKADRKGNKIERLQARLNRLQGK